MWGPAQVLALRLLHHFPSHPIFGFAPVVEHIGEYNAPAWQFKLPMTGSPESSSDSDRSSSSDDLEGWLEQADIDGLTQLQ